nr:uncharacterized protein LOC109409192 [Aedes albopictus]
MSNAEPKIEELVEVESLDEETAEFIAVLESFGSSDTIINAFLANQYTIDTLRIIERQEVEELIPQPFLAERTKFIHGLNEWRKQKNLPLLSGTGNPPAVSLPPAIPDLSRETCTAAYFLRSSAKGQAILNKYAESPFLTRTDKKSITQIVVDEFKDRFSKLTSSELEQRAIELSKLFPSEPKEVWYQSPWSTDGVGRRIKIRKQAKGRLYDRNINYKPIGVNNLQPPPSGSDAGQSAEEITDEQISEYQQTKKWIVHNQDEWEELKTKWKQTARLRIYELSKNTSKTAASILSEYSVFRNHQAYHLVQIDFQQRFPDKEKLLFDRWDQFLTGVLPILEAEVNDAEGKELLNHLRAQDITTDSQGFKTVLLLAHILPSPVLTFAQKRRWKPSIVESRDSVIIQVDNLAKLRTTLNKYFNSCREKGIDSTPFIVVHGSDPKHPEGFSVWNNVVAYKLPNLQKALDVCVKLFKTYDIPFPPQSSLIWNLLATFLYGFDAPPDQIHIAALCSSISSNN